MTQKLAEKHVQMVEAKLSALYRDIQKTGRMRFEPLRQFQLAVIDMIFGYNTHTLAITGVLS